MYNFISNKNRFIYVMAAFMVYTSFHVLASERDNAAIVSQQENNDESSFNVNDISFRIIDDDKKLVEVITSTIEQHNLEIIIPETVEYNGNNYTVTSIGPRAFFEGIFAKKTAIITMPNSITTVNDSAFYSDGITIKNIPDNIKYIGYAGFCFSQLPKGIEALPESIEYIGGSAFSGCDLSNLKTLPSKISVINEFTFSQSKIENLSLGEKIDSIMPNAFHSSGLKSISLPASLVFIGDSAFMGCNSLKSITVDDKNKLFSAKDNVLFNKDQSKLVVYPGAKSEEMYSIPSTVKEIGNSAFIQNNILTEVFFPESLEIIGDYAFANASNLSTAIMPLSIKHLGKGIFRTCYKLESTRIPEVDEISDQLFYGCISIKEITIPKTVRSIGVEAFGATSIDKINIPEGVHTIGDFALNGCGLKSITLPSTLEYIGLNACDYNFNLEEVCCKATTPPVTNSSFYLSINDNSILYVPYGTKDKYASAPEWKRFKTIKEGVPSSIKTDSSGETRIEINGNSVTLTCQNTNISIYELSGNIVYNRFIDGTETINLPCGIYIIKANDNVSKIYIK